MNFWTKNILIFGGGGGGNHFWTFPVLFHLFWMCCFIIPFIHDCMLHTIFQWAFNSFRLFKNYHRSLYNVIIFKLHQLSFTQLISFVEVQIFMFVLWMNNTYLIFFFKIKLEEVYETPTQFFMVLELVTGGELFDRSALE